MTAKKYIFLIIISLWGINFLSHVQTQPIVLNTGKVAIVFTTGGLDDNSFNAAAWRGKTMAEEKYGSNITIDYALPTSIIDFAGHQEAYAESNSYDLIICVGFLQNNDLNATAAVYPSQKFVLIDDTLPRQINVKGITFKEHEGSFLVGAMATMTTATNKIGFLGGLDIPLINRFLAGYTQGAEWISPDITVTVVYSPDPTNPWADPEGGKAQATTLHAVGCDVIYAAAGPTGIGVMQYANQIDGVYAIGVDYDQDYLFPGKVLCSMLKIYETAVFNSIDQVMQEKFDPTTDSILGIADNGVDISDMSYTQDIKHGDFFFGRYCETKTRGEWIENFTGEIITGGIVVANTPTTVPDPIPFNPCPTTTTQEPEPTTTTISEETTEKTTEETEPTTTEKPGTSITTTTTEEPETTTTTATILPTLADVITPGFNTLSTVIILCLIAGNMVKRKRIRK
jgi:basic membrane protein A